jgi:RNA polymerase sigma factor (sigma-70 family)
MTRTAASPILGLIRRVVEDQRVKALPDEELLRRFSTRHDEAAFAALLRRHGSMVLDLCRNMLRNEADAEDAFQATFLILAQRAGAIRQKSSVGSWLHGVAYRIALKTQAAFARRQKHEARTSGPAPTLPPDNLSWREVQQALHAELKRLSERYRAPLVLCYLEGNTHDEAAVLLGVSKAAVKKRLDSARALLRIRLLRRGLGPAAVLAVAVCPAATVSSAVPSALADSTIKVASLLAAGNATATGVVSAEVAALTQGVLNAMLVTKVKIATVVLLVIGIIGVGSGTAVPWGFAQNAREKQAAPTGTGEKNQSRKPEPARTSEFPDAIRFEQGATRFLKGDKITIVEVRGTADTFAPGNIYWIRGTYTLASHEKAILLASVTVTDLTSILAGHDLAVRADSVMPGTAPRADPGRATGVELKVQRASISRGTGTFTLFLPMSHTGMPHVSFYSVENGESFGGNYFGTGDTVLKRWWGSKEKD